MRRRGVCVGGGGVLAVVVCLLGGCAEKPKGSRVIDVAGTVEHVDPANKTLTVSTYLEKAKSEERFDVKVESETEILINGALARLEDIRVGERAQGRVRIERQGNNKAYVADQIRIERADAIVAPGADEPGGDDSDGEDTEGVPGESNGG